MNSPALTYALVTPARNEEDFIELTLRSVTAQTVHPLRWVIVSDGSTDRTDEIVERYVAEHEWIELVRMPERHGRNFAAKVTCFNTGFARLKDVPYDIVGNLDADVSFDADLFSFLLSKFESLPRLGIGGAALQERGASYDFRFSSPAHVSGSCQLFRRACYDAIGGYMPVPAGGIDVIAVLAARMHGWETRTFPEKVYTHHRVIGSAKYGVAMSKFKLGEKDYMLGRHPLWQLLRSVYQMTRRPFLIGGGALLGGYAWAMLRRVERSLPPELIRFQRREQLDRLKHLFRLGAAR